MPSKTMGQQGLSPSSCFSDEIGFPSERQIGFWKKEITTGHYADNNTIALPKFMQVDPQAEKFPGHKKPYSNCDQKVNAGTGTHVVGMGGASSYSSALWGPVARDLGGRSNLSAQSSYFAEGEKMNQMGAQYENGLFSSSFSDLFTRKLKLSGNDNLIGHSVDTVVNYQEDEPFESLQEIEAQTIGNLLPNDDDLLSGVADGLDHIIQPGGADDVEDLDLFSSLGGMDLGDDCSHAGQRNSKDSEGTFNNQLGDSSGLIPAEHPFGEHPSRTLFVRNINSNVEDSELRSLFEQYGDIRTLYTACKHRGFVMISYYDLRAARNAMSELQSRPLRRRKLDIHFSVPKDNLPEKDINQGTLLVFNLDSSVPNDEIRHIFGVYGDIKEIRETPHRSLHKFIEYFDTRAAESAFHALNWSDIAGKRIKLEHSRPGGARRLMQQLTTDLVQDDSRAYYQSNSSPSNPATGFSGLVSHEVVASSSMDNETILGMHSALRAPTTTFLENTFHHGISSSVPESLSSLMGADSVGNQPGFTEPRQPQSHLKFDFRGTTVFHPQSLPEYNDVLTNAAPCKSPVIIASSISTTPSERFENGQMHIINSKGRSVELNDGVFGSVGNGSCPPARHHFMWNNICSAQPPGMMWPNSPSFVNGVHAAPPRVHGIPSAPSHMLSTVATLTNHHVGSAPTVNPALWERHHAYAGGSPEASGFIPGSLGSMRINSLHPLDFVSPNMFPNVGANCMDLQIPPKNVGLHSHHQRCLMFPGRSQMIPLMSSFDSPNERGRSRRVENGYNQADKKQYELDIERILRGEDSRTTLMIKNIPNKYTSKMLLATIDERHRGTYDFVYLPIDFKNKCNVGYAFINMMDPTQIIPFYQEINGKKWEKFNSEKVASLAYARIQGKAALISHFQNSSLMNEDKRCRPILFHTDGPNAGDQVPFPMGVNIRSRAGKNRTSTTENHQGSPLNLENREESSSGESSSGSAKE